MPQLKEDECPADRQQTTTEKEGEGCDLPEKSGTRSDYTPKLPPDATATKDNVKSEQDDEGDR